MHLEAVSTPEQSDRVRNSARVLTDQYSAERDLPERLFTSLFWGGME